MRSIRSFLTPLPCATRTHTLPSKVQHKLLLETCCLDSRLSQGFYLHAILTALPSPLLPQAPVRCITPLRYLDHPPILMQSPGLLEGYGEDVTATACFCGNAVAPWSYYYCSRECALQDSNSALVTPKSYYRTFSMVAKERHGHFRNSVIMPPSNHSGMSVGDQNNHDSITSFSSSVRSRIPSFGISLFSIRSSVTPSEEEVTISPYVADIPAPERRESGIFLRPSLQPSGVAPMGIRDSLADLYPDWAPAERFCQDYDRTSVSSVSCVRSPSPQRDESMQFHSFTTNKTPAPPAGTAPLKLKRKAPISQLRSIKRRASTLFNIRRPRQRVEDKKRREDENNGFLGVFEDAEPLVKDDSKFPEAQLYQSTDISPTPLSPISQNRRSVRRSASFSGWRSPIIDGGRFSSDIGAITSAHNWIAFM